MVRTRVIAAAISEGGSDAAARSEGLEADWYPRSGLVWERRESPDETNGRQGLFCRCAGRDN
jgi:hypothetical protein